MKKLNLNNDLTRRFLVVIVLFALAGTVPWNDLAQLVAKHISSAINNNPDSIGGRLTSFLLINLLGFVGIIGAGMKYYVIPVAYLGLISKKEWFIIAFTMIWNAIAEGRRKRIEILPPIPRPTRRQ